MATVLKRLNAGLHEAFTEDARVYLIGEDLLDPYGGAFKVSAGLSSAYPERVLSSPVSEAGIVGVAGGMALRGLRPVVEIMFGDFVTLAADQVINSLSKFPWMYGGEVSVPVVIRTPMGGRRGYGPTHSQTLEKLFLGVPGLRVLAANSLDDPGALLKAAILEDDEPVLFIENKLLYAHEVGDEEALKDFEIKRNTPDEGYAAATLLRLKGAPDARVTMAAYGYMAELAREAVLRLAFEEELFCELYVPSQLTPLAKDGSLDAPLAESLGRTGAMLSVEEGGLSFGWGAEMGARAAQQFGNLQLRRVAAADQNIPASMALETAVLPSVEDIMAAAREMV